VPQKALLKLVLLTKKFKCHKKGYDFERKIHAIRLFKEGLGKKANIPRR
jgi:hypothetical protein